MGLISRIVVYCFLSLVAALVGLIALVVVFSSDLPSLAELEMIPVKQTTVIYARDGQILKEFAEERRKVVPVDLIPQEMIDAVIAVEDRKFWSHWGVDAAGIARALLVNVRERRIAQGASTITQQLARNIFLTLEVTLTRKIKEALTAIRIERTYSKHEIMAMYLNRVYFGHGTYGLEAAANYYFGMSTPDLTLDECALLTGLLKAPTTYSPFRNPDRARRRRDEVLDALVATGRLSPDGAAEAKAKPPALRTQPPNPGIAPHFTEHIRRQLEERLGSRAIYDTGLRVKTTLDVRAQRLAEETLLHQVAERQKRFDGSAEGRKRRRRSYPSLEDSLRATAVQGALLAMDIETGHVLAMVGGRDFIESKFNRTIQARRQPGSAFKPFVYTTAIQRGWRTTDRLLDAPVTVPMQDGTPWQPENFDKKFQGEVTLREALKFSRNLATIRLLLKLGPQAVVKTARRMGIRSPIQPFYSLAIGTSEVTLWELVAAYTTFPTYGVRVEPITMLRVVDRADKVLFERDGGRRSEVLEAPTAAIMTDMMHSVMKEGTGRGARLWYGFERPAGGKTGTTDDFTDAWFIGFTPQIVAGVWIGFDEKVPLGGHTSSAAAVALPVWAQFMREVHQALHLPILDFPPLPAGVTTLEVCRESGEVASLYCPDRVEELFRSGTEPTVICPLHGPGRPQARRDQTEVPRSARQLEF